MISEASFRYRFYPAPEQADLLNRTFGCVRVVYNRARAAREGAWTARREKFGFAETSALLTQWKKDPALSWLNDVSSVPLQQVLRHLDVAYRNFFRKTARYPGFRRKDGRQSAEFTKSGFNYRGGVLKLAKMAEPLAVVWSRPLPTAPTTVTVVREADGRWFVACRVLVTTSELTGGGSVGIDLGLTTLATLSTGEKIENPRQLAAHQKRLARVQKRLARKKKGSKNRAKARVKVARAYSAVCNARQDHLHKLSRRLVNENQVIVVESLSIQGMMKAKRHSRSISDAAWGGLVRMIAYKAGWHGRTLVKVGRWFPSTKMCSVCGTTGHVLSLSDREWDCSNCGTHHDRDVNAARNILAEGLSVIACGGGVSPGVLRHVGPSSMKQEPVS